MPILSNVNCVFGDEGLICNPHSVWATSQGSRKVGHPTHVYNHNIYAIYSDETNVRALVWISDGGLFVVLKCSSMP